MFTMLQPSETGIVTENAYDDPRMWGDLEMEFSLGSVGTGVAIGDYDNDGRPDVYIISKTGRSRLFRSLGSWKFEDVTGPAGLGGPGSGWLQKVKSWFELGEDTAEEGKPWEQGAAFADVNNDGWLDLYVCRFDAPNLLFINQGDGTFREEAAERGLALIDASGMGAFCDFDRDGWLDVYVHTNMRDAVAHPDGQRDYLLRNIGDGRFVDVTARAGISGLTFAHAAIWWDFNHDGWPDIYVSNDFAPADALYRNNGDGTFTDIINESVAHLPYSSMGADLGDVNNDGLIDFFVADMATTTHEKDQRSMAASRALSRADQDRPELAPQYLRNALHLNTGVPWMQEAAILAGIAATDWTWSVRLEDLDNDGYLDLHVTNGMNREYHNVDLRDRIVIAENPAERRRLLRDSPVLTERNLAFRNRGDLHFENVSASWGLDQDGVSFGASFGDLDGDGDLDLIVANYEAGATVLRNDCASGHRLIVALRGSVSNHFGVGATVRIESASGTQVRQLVVARGYLSSSEPVLHFGLGEDQHISRLTVEWPSGHVQSFAETIAADQHLTITEPAGPAPKRVVAPKPATQFIEVTDRTGLDLVAREEGLAESNQQPLLPFRFNRRGPALAVGDLNGDDHDDVLLGGTARQPAQIRLGASEDRFAPGATLPERSGPLLDDGPLVVFDANGDGHADILQTKASTALAAGVPEYASRLLLGDGTGRFQPAPAGMWPELPISAGAVAVGDFDRDGRLDVFIGGRVVPGRYPEPARSALLLNRGGRFEDVTLAFAPACQEVGLVTAALWTDADDDGWLDLLVACEWGGIRLFRNEAGRGFTDASAAAGFDSAGSGWWSSLAAADFNGDGRMDYFAGNVGLNTQYQASPESPATILLGRFRSGAAPLLIEAKHEQGKLFPWRTRKDLGAYVPAVRRRFPQNDAFARATLDELLGAEAIAQARRFTATEFRTGVFLSQPDGGRKFVPLPRLTQIAPAHGSVAGDFDGDGHADLFVVQNSHAPIPTIGRFDGGIGQLLRGDGRGSLHCVPAAESGLVVPGDARALVVLDLSRDGWPDFLVSRNDAPVIVWRNSGVTGRRPLAVQLRGPAGNPTAVGARVTCELADGSSQTTEVYAGSGYFSQSSASCFFGARDGEPRRLHVRWPSGARSTHEIAGAERKIEIAMP